MGGWHTMIQWQGRGRCQWPWEWVLYHEICLSPTPSTYSIIIQPIPWLRQVSVETFKWQSHNFESQLICSTHFPCNQFISDIKSLHFLALEIPRDIDIDKQRQVQRMQNWKKPQNKQKRTAWWFSLILCFAVLQKFLHNLAVKCCTLCNFWLASCVLVRSH